MEKDLNLEKNEAHEQKKHHEKNSKEHKKSLRAKFNELKGEFRKIIWPSRHDLAKQTVTVIVASLFVGVIIVLLDGGFGFALDYFTKLLG